MSLYPLHSSFVSNMTELLGSNEATRLIAALNREAPVSIRLNPNKHFFLNDKELDLQSVPWCTWGYYLPKRPNFTGDPLFHSGYYYVQEASSMLLYQIQKLLPDKPINALDLCAAPGGKSTLLLDMLSEGSLLISNEVIGRRANILMENLQKWGDPMSIITSAYPDKWGKLKDAFDLILVDAPCSGEGMFRKDLETRKEWNTNSPIECATRQRSILASVWPSLTPGGLLVYSTCTFNREENEDIVLYITEELGGKAIDLDINIEGVLQSPLSPYPCYRMMPHRTRGEGLFMAVIRKSGEKRPSSRNDRSSSKQGKSSLSLPIRELESWLQPQSKKWQWIADRETIYTYPSEFTPMLEQLTRHKIRTLSYGVPIATTKGKSPTPHPALAYSQILSQNAFERIELNYPEAITFLAKEPIILPNNLTQGIKLLTHKSIPLGFVKHLSNRCNSLLPSEWRIRQPERVRRLIESESLFPNSCLCHYLISD